MSFSTSATASACAGNGVRLLLSFLFDYTVIVILFGAVAALNFATPFQQHFALQNYTLHYPYAEHERVPEALLYVCSILIPAVIIALWTMALDVVLEIQRTKRQMRPKDTYMKGLWEFNGGILGLLLANVMAYVITGVLKNLVGKPRPDLISRCQPHVPQDQFVSPVYGLSNSSICTQPNLSILNDGFRSFPSGHSSSSFSGLFYLTLYLAGKLHFFDHQGQVWKVFVVLVPTVGATLIAVSRIMDARHHPFDVITGSFLGVACAIIAYRQYFPCVASFNNVGRAYTIRRNFGRSGQEPLRIVNHVSDEKEISQCRADRDEPTTSGEAWDTRNQHHSHESFDEHMMRLPHISTSGMSSPDSARSCKAPPPSRESKIPGSNLTTRIGLVSGQTISPSQPKFYDFAHRPLNRTSLRDRMDMISEPKNPRDTLGMSPSSAHILEGEWPPSSSHLPEATKRHRESQYSSPRTQDRRSSELDPVYTTRPSYPRASPQSLIPQSQPQRPFEAQIQTQPGPTDPPRSRPRPALCSPHRPYPTALALSDQDYRINPGDKTVATIKRKPASIPGHPPATTTSSTGVNQIANVEFPGSSREDGPSTVVELPGDWSASRRRSRRGIQASVSISPGSVHKIDVGGRKREEQKEDAVGVGPTLQKSNSGETWREKELPKVPPEINVVAVDGKVAAHVEPGTEATDKQRDGKPIGSLQRIPLITDMIGKYYEREDDDGGNDGHKGFDGYDAVEVDADEEQGRKVRDLLFGGRKYSFEEDDIADFEDFMGSKEDEERLLHPVFRGERGSQ